MSVLTTFPGSKGNLYQIKLGRDGKIYCSCPGWKFCKGSSKTCKHLKSLKESLNAESPETLPTSTPEAFRAPKAPSRIAIIQIPRALQDRKQQQLLRFFQVMFDKLGYPLIDIKFLKKAQVMLRFEALDDFEKERIQEFLDQISQVSGMEFILIGVN